MKKSLRSLCAITTISLCAMGNLFAVDNNYFNSVYMIDQKQSLVQEWDKVFPQSDKVHHKTCISTLNCCTISKKILE